MEQKLPPLWGNTFWWTRAGALLGLAAFSFWVVMLGLLSEHAGSCGLPNQLTAPILAIEVAGTWSDVAAIVGPCEASHCGQSQDATACQANGGECKTICPDKVEAFQTEQYEDYILIVAYWLFFLYLGIVSWKFCYWARWPSVTRVLGKVAGAVIIAAGTWGALKDWRENGQILAALGELHMTAGPAPLMRDFAYEKWRFLFLAMGAAAPLFLFWTGKSNPADARPSAFSHLMAWATAVLAIATAWTGVAASLDGDDHRLEVAAGRLYLVILAATVTLGTAQLWRGGTMAGLNRLAHYPVLRLFANLLSGRRNEQQSV